MKKFAFTYKGLKQVRKHLNASRDLTKRLESDPSATRDELVKAVGHIGDRRVRARQFITKNEDWDTIQEFNNLSKRLIAKRRGLEKSGGFKPPLGVSAHLDHLSSSRKRLLINTLLHARKRRL
jgi:hypothetical protein